MRDLEKENFDAIEDFYISIFLIGYGKVGESCIFTIFSEKPKKKYLYTAVIDCYKEENLNITKIILEKLDLKEKIDMLVWTHPHDDHTLGLDEIINGFCNENTKIICANILDSNKKYSSACEQLIKIIASKNYNNHGERWNINPMEHLGTELQKIKFSSTESCINKVLVRCIAPCSDISASYSKMESDSINELSIAILVEIETKAGNMNFLFGGDIENKTILEICQEQEDYDIPSTYNFIKIPHHGGKSASKLIELLDITDKSDVAGTTVKYVSEVIRTELANPSKKVLKDYGQYINHICCTTDIDADKLDKGVLHIKYDYTNKEYSVIPYGRAIKKIGV